MAQHHLRLDWTSKDGDRSYIEISTFTPKLVNGELCMEIYSVSMDAGGLIHRGGPRSWSAFRTLSVERARKIYKKCLELGYRAVETVPEGRYFDQVPA